MSIDICTIKSKNSGYAYVEYSVFYASTPF